MGYETILLVGRDTGQTFNTTDGTYFQVYAHVDMCKLGNTALFNLPWRNETPKEKIWYFYPIAGDGDTVVTKDQYGDMPQPIPLLDVINALEQDIKETDYRRLTWALQLLKSMHDTSPEGLSVMLWSY